MGKRRKRHERDDRKIASDVAFVINQDDEALSFNAKQAVIKNAIWVWTQRHGKIKGCQIWTVDARNAERKSLRHEHVVPIRVIRDQVLGMKPATTEDVHESL